MKLENCKAYEVIERKTIHDLQSEGYVLRHKKTGAKVVLLSNDDDNKVFYIGFRTPPTDSTGVAHILEHSVLCGSDRYPVKDPFVELAKGSLNTFLNAMTYPDKTVYPVASCNEQDFKNLMDVYLDAVFHPNIYHEEKIFRQEGWHYEMEKASDDLSINGVVYNEMKGVFSSPDDVLDREVFNSLFPNTPYGVESGGDPDHIPDLTYEQFLDFHRRYYHPSNSFIYLYGDMDMEERLNYLDVAYLSSYDAIDIDSEIPMQEGFSTLNEVRKEYPITDEEPLEGNSYLAYNKVIGTSLDRELYVAFQVLDYALCSIPGAPLKLALTKAGIGTDIYSIYENGIKQPYFSIVSKNTDSNRKEAFVQLVEDELRRLVQNGIDKKAILAAINYFEFKYREADFGAYPKGLMYGLQIFDSWLYDETLPFIHIEANETFSLLRKKADTDYFELLIQKYLLDNTHGSVIVVEPVRGLTGKREAALKEKMQAIKDGLTDDQINEIVEKTAALKAYQEAEDDPEDLLKIPMLSREDLRKIATPLTNRFENVEGTEVIYHDIYTNGIDYVTLLFDLSRVSEDLFPYISLLPNVLGMMDTKHYAYGDLFNEVNIETGGINMDVKVYGSNVDEKRCRCFYLMRGKALHNKVERLFYFMQEILCGTGLNNKERLHEILSETKSQIQAGYMSSGHSLAALRAGSYFSISSAYSEVLNGFTSYRLLEDLEQHFDEKADDLIQKLEAVCKAIFRPENLVVDITAKEEDAEFVKNISALKESLFSDLYIPGSFVPVLDKKNEGFMNSGRIQYVCRAGNFKNKNLPYHGSLRVLRVIMGYDYLWNNVRVKGGAYGCMCNFSANGDCYFVSYRDPNLKKTIEVYENAAKYVGEFDADERGMTKYIIGAVSESDRPLSPSAKGMRSLFAYMSDHTYEDLQRIRTEMLETTPEDIRRFSAYLKAFLSDDCLCVVGNQDQIKEDASLFKSTESLFKN